MNAAALAASWAALAIVLAVLARLGARWDLGAPRETAGIHELLELARRAP